MFFRTLFKNKKLRKKMATTFFLLVLFRFLSFVPVPWINAEKIRGFVDNSLLEMAGLLSGGALQGFTLMATGISSYITASIIVQLLTYSIPRLYELSKSPNAEESMNRITKMISIFLSITTSIGMTMYLDNQMGFLIRSDWVAYLGIALIHTLGTFIAVAIGEKITEDGIGNGVSLLIFTNVISTLPEKMFNIVNNPLFTMDQKKIFAGTLVAMVFLVVILELSEKRIEVKYAKNVINDAGMTGPNYIPLKLNINGVMPIIFSTTIIQTLMIIAEFANIDKVNDIMYKIGPGTNIYPLITTILIFVFSFFYSSLIFNPKDIADNLQNSGGLIGNVRPGKSTANYLKKEGREVTLINSIFLAALSLLPVVTLTNLGFPIIGATTLMIVISVAIEIYSDVKLEVELTSNTLRIDDMIS